jgi:hypothetical protein
VTPRTSLEPISELAQENESTGEVEKSEEVLGLHLVTGDEAAEEVEPGEKSFHLPSALVAPQLAPVLRGLALAAPTVRGNQLHAALVPESLVEFVAVVGLVSDEALGEFIEEGFVERSLEDFDLVGRSARDANGDRKTSAVDSCHDLGPLPALRLSDAEPPFFAPEKDASTKPSSKSKPPRSFRSRASSRSTLRKVPSFTQP